EELANIEDRGARTLSAPSNPRHIAAKSAKAALVAPSRPQSGRQSLGTQGSVVRDEQPAPGRPQRQSAAAASGHCRPSGATPQAALPSPGPTGPRVEEVKQEESLEDAPQAFVYFCSGSGGMESLLCAVGLAQGSIYHSNDLAWNEIDYYLQVRQVHIDTLNNMREDLRDLYEMDSRKIDNSLIVTTLMLSIGFGFVVEGTFPPPGKVSQTEEVLRVTYAVVAGLALICPFWSMLSLVESKRRLDFFMDKFTHGFYVLLRKRIDGFVEESRHSVSIRSSHLVRHTQDLPQHWPQRLPQMCPKRASNRASERRARPKLWEPGAAWQGEGEDEDEVETTSSGLVGQNGNTRPEDIQFVLMLHNSYTEWWDHWCSWIYSAAGVFLWLGIVFNVLCCALLLGMYFRDSYPDTPSMWKAYVLVVGSGIGVAIPAAALASYSRCGPFQNYQVALAARAGHLARENERGAMTPFSGATETVQGIPGWMLQPLLTAEDFVPTVPINF
ncbi:unnamed protein product, partial [Polarella glacialis]